MMIDNLAGLAERRLDNGLLGQWYILAKSSQLADKPLGVRALGRDLVLWRGEDNMVRCLDDRCPHRGAPLSRGQMAGNHVACQYHGVQVDGDGVIARVPALANCALEGRKAVQAYMVEEHEDGVFVYFPSAEQPVAPPLALPVELHDPEFATFLCTATWDTNYRYVLDNLVDPMHGIYLHADTFTLSEGLTEDLVSVQKTPGGFVILRRGQQGLNFDKAEIDYENGLIYGRVEIPYPPAGGPGGMMRVLAMVTPIDLTRCQIFFWRCRRLSGLTRDTWRFMYRAAFEQRHWDVLEQDREMLAAMPNDARDHELLYQHDLGVGNLRRALGRKALSQVAAEMPLAAHAAE